MFKTFIFFWGIGYFGAVEKVEIAASAFGLAMTEGISNDEQGISNYEVRLPRAASPLAMTF